MSDILDAFDGRYKAQKDINSNWLAVTPVPGPRPGTCVDDSRTLSSSTFNFVKTHSLMETAVNAFSGRPLLIRTNQDYKLTSVAVDSQVKALNGQSYDVIFVGTTNGKIIKFINIFENGKEPIVNVITESQVLPSGMPVKEITVSKKTSSIIVIGNGHVVSIPLHECKKINRCHECLLLQDPYCMWDSKNQECTSSDTIGNHTEHLLQDILGLQRNLCRKYGNENSVEQNPTVLTQSTHGTVSGIGRAPIFDNEITMTSIHVNDLTNTINAQQNNIPQSDSISKDRSIDDGSNPIEAINLSAISRVAIVIICIVIGVAIGICISKITINRPNSNFHHEGRNQLSWPSPGSKSRHIIPPREKDINLLINAAQFASAQCNNKKDNIEHAFDDGKDRSHECKNSTESLEKEIPPKMGTGTLQKVKKTYI